MSSGNDHAGYDATRRHYARLRRTGAVVLALGIAGAGIRYWQGTRHPDFSDDLSMTGFDRAQSQQMGILFGKSGLMADDLVGALKRPGVQAGLIAAGSLAFALSCFYLGRPLEPEGVQAGSSASQDQPPTI